MSIENKIVSKINFGLLIFLGIEIEDTKEDSLWLANKIAQLRIFSDSDAKMNNSLLDIEGETLLLSLKQKSKKILNTFLEQTGRK